MELKTQKSSVNTSPFHYVTVVLLPTPALPPSTKEIKLLFFKKSSTLTLRNERVSYKVNWTRRGEKETCTLLGV